MIQSAPEIASNQRQRSHDVFVALALIPVLSAILVCAAGGIVIGESNHVGLLPVVRRMVDPGYLPNDFGISLRWYHHFPFAVMLGWMSALLGENTAVVIMSFAGRVVFLGGLFSFCRVLGMRPWAFAGCAVGLGLTLLHAGEGLEINTLLGNGVIQPPIFAHGAVLGALAAIATGRPLAAAASLGLATLCHLQIGILATAFLAPAFVYRISGDKPLLSRGAVVKSLLLWAIPASPCVAIAAVALHQGGQHAAWNVDYLSLRMPHHMELASMGALIWYLFHLSFVALAAFWFDRRCERARSVWRLSLYFALAISLASSLHFLDYYWVRWGGIAKLQFLRLTPFVTGFGLVALLAVTIDGYRSRRLPGSKVALLGMGWAALGLFHSLPGTLHSVQRHWAWAVTTPWDDPDDWTDMCGWIARFGPAEATYLTPPGKEGFTYLSNRSTVVEFKTNPDGGRLLTEWTARLADLSGGALPKGRGFEMETLLNERFASLDAAERRRIGQKYGATYAVLPSAAEDDGGVLYRNRSFKLVILGTAP